ncbi:unnamed protein product [Symbiodinium sp. CCMP2592]|nr:unnamed protein product [Symbiodinium sp. CCMP2592]
MEFPRSILLLLRLALFAGAVRDLDFEAERLGIGPPKVGSALEITAEPGEAKAHTSRYLQPEDVEFKAERLSIAPPQDVVGSTLEVAVQTKASSYDLDCALPEGEVTDLAAACPEAPKQKKPGEVRIPRGQSWRLSAQKSGFCIKDDSYLAYCGYFPGAVPSWCPDAFSHLVANIVLEDGASLSLEGLKLTTLITAVDGGTVKLKAAKCYLRTSLQRREHWLQFSGIKADIDVEDCMFRGAAALYDGDLNLRVARSKGEGSVIVEGGNASIVLDRSQMSSLSVEGERQDLHIFHSNMGNIRAYGYRGGPGSSVKIENCCVDAASRTIAVDVDNARLDVRKSTILGSWDGSSGGVRFVQEAPTGMSLEDVYIGFVTQGVRADCYTSYDRTRRDLSLKRVIVEAALETGITMSRCMASVKELTVRHSKLGVAAAESAHINADDVVVTSCHYGISMQTSEGKISGLAVLNDIYDVSEPADRDTFEYHQSVYRLPFIPEGIFPRTICMVGFYAAATEALRMSVRCYYVYSHEQKKLFRALPFVGTGLAFAFLVVAVLIPLEVLRDTRLLSKRAVNVPSEAQSREKAFHVDFAFVRGVPHENICKFFCVCFLLSTLSSFCYLFFAVYRCISDWRALAELRGSEKLMKEKEELKKKLDNPELRQDMAKLHEELLEVMSFDDEASTESIFDEMKTKSKAECANIAVWFHERRALYMKHNDGKRMQELEAIESKTVMTPVQSSLPPAHSGDEKKAIDFLYRMGSWLRSSFEQDLVEVCKRINDMADADLASLGLLHQLKFEPLMHPLQPDPKAKKVGKHVGLLVAPIKAKDRAYEKTVDDYAKDPSKHEKPAARYVCDFLRATIFAADPFVLAVAFRQVEKAFDIVRVKNKFINEKLPPEERTNILVNLHVKAEGRPA